MKFGAQVNVYSTTWDDIERSVQAMEAGRWNSLWFADHYLPPGSKPETESLTAFEGFSALSAVAGMTERLELGHLVLGNTYRNPGLTAKMAGTIDHISRGRFTLAIGAAWYEREHEAYGWDFPSMKERQDRLEEACELIRALFTSEDPVDYEGRYYRLKSAPLSPGCYREPHIPIMVGGTGEKRTLRTLARYGDVMNLDGWARQGVSVEHFRHKVSVLERHCEEVGRDPAEIKKTVLMPIRITDDEGAAQRFIRALGEGTVAGSRQYVIDRIGELGEAGVSEIMFGAIPTGDVEAFERVEEQILSAF